MVVATGSPGMTAYFTGYRVVDMLGGNERRMGALFCNRRLIISLYGFALSARRSDL